MGKAHLKLCGPPYYYFLGQPSICLKIFLIRSIKKYFIGLNSVFALSKIFFSLVIDTSSFRKWLLVVECRGEEGESRYKKFERIQVRVGAIVK